MKILYFSPYSASIFSQKFPAIDCNYEIRTTWTETLIEHLSKDSDIEISLATVSFPIKKDYSFKEKGVNYYYIKSSKKARRLKLFLPDIIKLRKLIKRVNPDIIHVHGAEDCYALASLYLEIPVLVSIQAAMREISKFYPWHSSMKLSPLFVDLALKKSKYIHANTPYIENYYKRMLKNAKIFRLDMPVNKSFFEVQNSPDKDVITFVGSSLIMKGADTLIKIAGLLKTDFPNLEVNIIRYGTKDKFDFLKKLVVAYRVDKIINFIGPLNSLEIAQQLSKTKVLVVPTRCDIYGVSLAEALSAGVPVISSNIMGVPYVIADKIDGFLFHPEDIEGFTKKASLLLSNENLRKRMGKKGQEKARRRFHPDIITKRHIEVYKEIINNRRKR